MASVFVESMVGKWRTLPAKGVPASSRRSASSSKASAINGMVGDMISTFRHNAHAEVDGGGGVGQRAGGDEVNASFSVFADCVQLNTAGGLNRYLEVACVDKLDGGRYLGGCHVVEQDGFRATFDGLFEFLAIAHLHLHALAGLARRKRSRKYFGDAAAERDVVVLDEDAVGEVEAMVLAAAAGDGVFVQQAQPGHRLARVQHFRFGALHLVDVAARDGSDAAHALHQVEDDALAGKQNVCGRADDGNRLSPFDAHPIEDFRMMDDFVTDWIRPSGRLTEAGIDVQKAGNAAEAGDNTLLLGHDGAGGTQFGIDGVGRCNVFERLIFPQGVFQDSSDSLTLPVHTLPHDTPRLRGDLGRLELGFMKRQVRWKN